MSPERSRTWPSRRERISWSINAEASRPAPLVDPDVAPVMAHFVERVDGNPPEGALLLGWVAVDDRSVPVGWTQAVQVVGEHRRHIRELSRDVLEILLGVPVVLDPLVATHRVKGGRVDAAGSKQTFPVYEQHVPVV